ncbi:histidine phosphatase family protein [Thalassotalea piscium]
MQTTLYLARHGQTLWNLQQRFQGQLDSELTELGRQQSHQLAQSLSDKAIDYVISSPLGRAVATANICQQHLKTPTAVETQLSERNLGLWQGREVSTLASEAIYTEVLQQYTDIAPAKGESAQACGQRIYHAIETIAQRAPNKRILVIFHGEALRCFLLALGQEYSENAYELFSNACVYKFSYQHQDAAFKAC